MKKFNKVCLVGCGGSGSQILMALAPVYDMVIYDGDDFEEKNITRQIFTAVGKNKATELSKFFSRAGKTIKGIPKMITGSEKLKGVDLIIACVDNNRARIAAQTLADEHDIPLIITGNESWEPMAWLYLPDYRDTSVDPFVKWKLGELQDGRQETCSGVEIIAEIPQLPQANFVAASFALIIMHSLETVSTQKNLVAEITATPNPQYKKLKEL